MLASRPMEALRRDSRGIKFAMNTTPKKSEPTQQPMGVYSDPGWKNQIESEAQYESQRFDGSPKARRRHHRDQRLLEEFLQTLPPGQIMLDAPSGQGRFSEVIQRAGHKVLAMEINFGRVHDAAERCKSKIVGVQGDVLSIPCGDRVFGAAVCFRLFHHLTPQLVQRVLVELRRVSERALVTYYNQNTWNYYRQRLEGKTPHRNFHSKALMRRWCEAAGWKVERARPALDIFNNLHALWLR